MIGGLHPATIYQVRVFAENEMGRSKEGRVLQVSSFISIWPSPLWWQPVCHGWWKTRGNTKKYKNKCYFTNRYLFLKQYCSVSKNFIWLIFVKLNSDCKLSVLKRNIFCVFFSNSELDIMWDEPTPEVCHGTIVRYNVGFKKFR